MTLYFNRQPMKKRRRQLRNNATDAERCMWEILRKRQIDGIRFRRQFSIGSFVLDFFCPALRFGIEVDGSIHNLPEVQKRDRIRQEALEMLNIRILRFTNNEVMTKAEDVKKRIKSQIEAQLSSVSLAKGKGAEGGCQTGG